MFLVGLTGGIASGKSTVCQTFKGLGCPVIDADAIARQVVEPGEPAYIKIKEIFGLEVFLPNGHLNREKLGQIVFQDTAKRRNLNAIVHPAIKKRMLWQILTYLIKGCQFVILDVPLLFETKDLLPFVSYTIVVYCTDEQQLSRLMERNCLSEEDANSRIYSQIPLSEKRQLGTFVVDNCGSIEKTREQVEHIFLKLRSSNKHLLFRFGLFTIISCIIGGLLMCI